MMTYLYALGFTEHSIVQKNIRLTANPTTFQVYGDGQVAVLTHYVEHPQYASINWAIARLTKPDALK